MDKNCPHCAKARQQRIDMHWIGALVLAVILGIPALMLIGKAAS